MNGTDPTLDSAPTLVLSGVRVTRRRAVVVDIPELRLDAGSTVLAGANGSGKSSLTTAIAGLRRFTGGIVVNGEDVRSAAGRRAVAYLPQGPGGFDHLRVGHAVEYARALPGPKAASADRDPVGAVLERVGIAALRDRRIGALSGGERMLAYAAMVLVGRPAVVVLDEPTVGLDAEHRMLLRSAVRSVARESVVLVVSHLPDDIEQLGDRVVVMRRGAVVFDGDGEELRVVGERAEAGGATVVDSALAHLERESSRP